MITWADFHIRLHKEGVTSWDTVAARKDGLIVKHYDFPPALPKTLYNDVPGMDGAIDATEIIGLYYENRTCNIQFKALLSEHAFDIDDFISYYHGRLVDFNICDTGWYYTGRLTVKNVNQVHDDILEFDVDINADPYKYKATYSSKAITILKNQNSVIEETFSVVSGQVTAKSAGITDTSLYMIGARGSYATFMRALTPGRNYLFTGLVDGGYFDLRDENGNVYQDINSNHSLYFTAIGNYLYIRLYTNGTSRSIYTSSSDDRGTVLGRASIEQPILLDLTETSGIAVIANSGVMHNLKYTTPLGKNCILIVDGKPVVLDGSKNTDEYLRIPRGSPILFASTLLDQSDSPEGGSLLLSWKEGAL